MSPTNIRTPDQRLRVFVSSTLQEVAAERKAARDAITRLRLAPVMFELGARPHPARELYRAYLDQSQIFIGIYWQRYGWIAPGETISGLEDEYRLARDKPQLVYIKSPAPDREPRLKALLDDMKSAVSYKYFSSASELSDLIENDLMLLLTERFEPSSDQPVPAVTADTPSNLPRALSQFIGREHELKAIKDRLAEARMLTLTGSGGTGKTRLALQAATDLQDDFDGRVYFVDLASTRDTDAALAAIAKAIGVEEHSDTGLLQVFKSHIGTQRMLLLLDNFEQVLAAAPAMAELLQECPGLKHLVTSREALRVRGEQVFPVLPLSLPNPDTRHRSIAQLAESEAVELFVERARAVKPDFRLTDENAGAVAEACLRLDGLPLAIELAAARLTLFTPQALAERLGDGMRLLRGGARDLPVRQQTLRDTIDWSYQLLNPEEQRLLQVLSVFSGGTLESVDGVVSRIRQSVKIDVDTYEGMSSLLDKSLIQQKGETDGRSRLTMLETVREFSAAQLEEDADFYAAIRRAHATYFADLTQRGWDALNEDGATAVWEQVAADIENIQIAWRYWLAERNLEELGKVTESLWALFDARGWNHAMLGLATDLLGIVSSIPSTPDRVRDQIRWQTNLARVLFALHGYTPDVEEAYTRALELCGDGNHVMQSYPVLRGLSTFYLLHAELEKGAEMGRQLLSLAERHDDAIARIEGHLVLGACLAMGGGADVRSGLEHLEAGLASYSPGLRGSHSFRLGNDPGVVCLAVSGLALWMLGFPDRALSRADEAIVLSRRVNHPQSMAYALFHASLLSLWIREDELADTRAQAVMEIADEHDFPIWAAVASCIRGTALAGMGSPEQGLALIEKGMYAYVGLRAAPAFGPLLLYVQAKAYGAAGLPAEGLKLIDEALAIAAQGSERALSSEFFQLKGDLLLALSPENAAEAEVLFLDAVKVAADADAWMLQLRSAIRLDRLWRDQAKSEQARKLLGGVYAKFTEGFSNADVREARALLDDMTPVP